MGSVLMLGLAPRAVVFSCIGLIAFAGAAAAQAPIVYAGQDNPNSLAGGGERSYGYGSRSRDSDGPVIDLRRNGSGRVVETAAEAPAQQTAADAEEQGTQPAWLERERVGPPYEANGRWYVPTPEPGYEQTGTASWYGPTFHGRRTASGETFDQEALTAAHPTLPIPSLVQVTNLENGREVIVRVNDRGPFVGDRLIDMSRRAAEVLGFESAGHAQVHVRYLGPAPRRVNADRSSAPVAAPSSVPAPAPAAEYAVAGEGPASLLPPPSTPAGELAGAPLSQPPAVVAAASASRAYASAEVAPGGYFVQVGAYSDPGNAQRVRETVAAAGPVLVDVRRSASGAELFRVRVGPWATLEEAEGARRTLATLGYAESVVAAR
jgi:rare lipoprotein A